MRIFVGLDLIGMGGSGKGLSRGGVAAEDLKAKVLSMVEINVIASFSLMLPCTSAKPLPEDQSLLTYEIKSSIVVSCDAIRISLLEY